MITSISDINGNIESFDSFEQALEYEKELNAWKFSIDIKKIMRINGIKTKNIACKINKSPAYVSRALNKGSNLTINSMTELALALNCKINFNIIPNSVVAEDIKPKKIQKHVNWRVPESTAISPVLGENYTAMCAYNDDWESQEMMKVQNGD